jgi:hypothetical protein
VINFNKIKLNAFIKGDFCPQSGAYLAIDQGANSATQSGAYLAIDMRKTILYLRLILSSWLLIAESWLLFLWYNPTR